MYYECLSKIQRSSKLHKSIYFISRFAELAAPGMPHLRTNAEDAAAKSSDGKDESLNVKLNVIIFTLHH